MRAAGWRKHSRAGEGKEGADRLLCGHTCRPEGPWEEETGWKQWGKAEPVCQCPVMRQHPWSAREEFAVKLNMNSRPERPLLAVALGPGRRLSHRPFCSVDVRVG